MSSQFIVKIQVNSRGFCFGYSQNSNVCAWGIPCFVFIVAAGCWELTYPFWKGGLKMFFLFRLSDMLPSLKLTNRPWKLLVGRLLSFWDTIFSGAMLVSGRIVCWRVYYVYIYIYVLYDKEDLYWCFWLPPQQAAFMTMLRSSVSFVFLDSFFRCDEPRGVEICWSTARHFWTSFNRKTQ